MTTLVLKRIEKITLLNKRRNEEASKYLLSLEQVQETKKIQSPYENVRDYILQMKDIAYRYSCIKQFCLNFTRKKTSFYRTIT